MSSYDILNDSAHDNTAVTALADVLKKLHPDSPYKKFLQELARNDDRNPNDPIALAQSALDFADRLEKNAKAANAPQSFSGENAREAMWNNASNADRRAFRQAMGAPTPGMKRRQFIVTALTAITGTKALGHARGMFDALNENRTLEHQADERRKAPNYQGHKEDAVENNLREGAQSAYEKGNSELRWTLGYGLATFAQMGFLAAAVHTVKVADKNADQEMTKTLDAIVNNIDATMREARRKLAESAKEAGKTLVHR